MATERQIAANRANARRSTGPKTALGKMVSSRNSFRHGLSRPSRLGFAMSSEVHAIARALTSEGISEHWASAVDFASAQLELLDIRAIREGMLLGVGIEDMNTQQLRRLASLDRYERYSQTRRRRASDKL
jgi:hypothetical protein